MYKTMHEYAKENASLSRMPEDYRLLSNFTHPLGISIERIDNVNGRGLLSPSDTTWLCLFIEIAERYISMSAKEITDFFSERFVPLLGKEIEVLKLYYEKQPEAESEQV